MRAPIPDPVWPGGIGHGAERLERGHPARLPHPDGDGEEKAGPTSPPSTSQSGSAEPAGDAAARAGAELTAALTRLQMIADAAKDGASLTWIRAVAQEGLRGEPLAELPATPPSPTLVGTCCPTCKGTGNSGNFDIGDEHCGDCQGTGVIRPPEPPTAVCSCPSFLTKLLQDFDNNKCLRCGKPITAVTPSPMGSK